MSIRDDKNWKIRDEDISAYLDVCRKAATDDAVFATFKRNQAYTKILEHCPDEVALAYFHEVLITNPNLINERTLSNDDTGGASKTIKGHSITTRVASCSNSTMQYIGILNRIIQHIGILDGMSIIEVGGGYGGQAKVIMEQFPSVSQYNIFDLDEAGILQDRYLKDYPAFAANFLNGHREFDLFISNYALSEVSDPMQTGYITGPAAACKHGYITCNSPLYHPELLPPHKIVPDIKGEAPDNFIIIW